MALGMTAASQLDVLVLFGVTGDLAHKMIFPALSAMVKRDALKIPVIGAASPKWSLAQLRDRVQDSITRAGLADHGDIDETLPVRARSCDEMLARFAKAGIDTDALAAQLQEEGPKRSSSPGTSCWSASRPRAPRSRKPVESGRLCQLPPDLRGIAIQQRSSGSRKGKVPALPRARGSFRISATVACLLF